MPTGRPTGSAIPCPLSTHIITPTVPAIRAVEYPNMRPRVSHGASRKSARTIHHLRLPVRKPTLPDGFQVLSSAPLFPFWPDPLAGGRQDQTPSQPMLIDPAPAPSRR